MNLLEWSEKNGFEYSILSEVLEGSGIPYKYSMFSGYTVDVGNIQKLEQLYNEEMSRRRCEEEAGLSALAGAGVDTRPDPEESVKRFLGEAQGLASVYHVTGARGRTIDVYPHKCVITTEPGLGSAISGNATDGEKTVYYQDCVGLQVKYPGFTLGYIQLETASPVMNNGTSNFFNENTFTYDGSSISEAEMRIVVDYIKNQLEKVKEIQLGHDFASL